MVTFAGIGLYLALTATTVTCEITFSIPSCGPMVNMFTENTFTDILYIDLYNTLIAYIGVDLGGAARARVPNN